MLETNPQLIAVPQAYETSLLTEINLEQEETTLKRAETRLEQVEKVWSRQKKLGAGIEANLEQVEASLEQVEASLELHELTPEPYETIPQQETDPHPYEKVLTIYETFQQPTGLQLETSACGVIQTKSKDGNRFAVSQNKSW